MKAPEMIEVELEIAEYKKVKVILCFPYYFRSKILDSTTYGEITKNGNGTFCVKTVVETDRKAKFQLELEDNLPNLYGYDNFLKPACKCEQYHFQQVVQRVASLLMK